MIATLKDKDSVLRILGHYNLSIDPSLIIDQSEIKTKLEALNKILDLKDVTKEEIVFIDDNIAHLMEPKRDGFKSFMAAWSNVSESSKALAKANNIDILNDLKIFSGE
jgi:FMN phosphatase YigB (HAD superfamily)